MGNQEKMQWGEKRALIWTAILILTALPWYSVVVLDLQKTAQGMLIFWISGPISLVIFFVWWWYFVRINETGEPSVQLKEATVRAKLGYGGENKD